MAALYRCSLSRRPPLPLTSLSLSLPQPLRPPAHHAYAAETIWLRLRLLHSGGCTLTYVPYVCVQVDEVLQQMVFGLEEELELRSQQAPPLDARTPSFAATSAAGPYGGMVPLPPYLAAAAPGWDFGSAQGSYQYQSQQQTQQQQQQQQQRQAASAAVDPSTVVAPLAPARAKGVPSDGTSPTTDDARGSGAPADEGGMHDARGALDGSAGDAADERAGDGGGDAARPTEGAARAREYRLPRQQRAILGRFGRALMEAVQVIGKNG
jgi:hypothetical protein